MTENISLQVGPIDDDPVPMASTATKLKTFTIAKGTKAQITQAYSDGLIGATDFAIATDEDLLDNKADKDLSNLSSGLTNTICTTPATTTSTASNATPAVVVENYVNGTNWYRIWSDGWIEQGGSGVTSDSYTYNKTITFLVPFKDTNYTLEGVGFFIDSIGAQVITAVNKKVTGFTTTSHTHNAGTNWWRACGYIR